MLLAFMFFLLHRNEERVMPPKSLLPQWHFLGVFCLGLYLVQANLKLILYSFAAFKTSAYS